MSSGSKNSILVQRDGDRIWTLVDVDASQINDEASDTNDSDSSSIVRCGGRLKEFLIKHQQHCQHQSRSNGDCEVDARCFHKRAFCENEGPLDAKLEAFRLPAYHVSNNPIEDIEDEDGMEEESRFSRIIDMFRDLNLPRRMWAKTFSVGQDQTSAAFAEALFEAAINTGSSDIVQALLEASIDPN
ncbi:hypothetical protein RJZ90_005963 [Blastomyces dermatitidis]